VGVALFPDDGATVEELTRCADHAMYAAKSAGKSQCKSWRHEVLEIV